MPGGMCDTMRYPVRKPARPRPAPARRVLVAGLAAVGLLAPAGCAASYAHGVGSTSPVVNALAASLDHGDNKPYRATYRLADGSTATVAHGTKPERRGYEFSTGSLHTDKRATSACTVAAGATSCVLTGPPVANAQPDLAAIRTAGGGRFVPAEQLMSLVTNAGLAHHGTIHRSTTTIAGQAVTCADVTGATGPAARFTGCLTDAGVLARFTGTVSGLTVDVTLTGVEDTVPADAGAPPVGAHIVDHRHS